jgi:CubicO group peptidase (beta-lactamase class C family)
MMWVTNLLTTSVALATIPWANAATATAPNCPIQGPAFPKPQKLSSSTTMQAAFKNLTEQFTSRDADNTTGAQAMSYSLEVFSASEGTPIWKWYHTAPTLAKSNTTGVRAVDGNTVYRLGSLTKVFTIYTFLLEVGDANFNDPITKFVPELAAIATNRSKDPVDNTDWNSITIGSIAAQLTGLIRDCE